jgi:hypothetical protein
VHILNSPRGFSQNFHLLPPPPSLTMARKGEGRGRIGGGLGARCGGAPSQGAVSAAREGEPGVRVQGASGRASRAGGGEGGGGAADRGGEGR